MADETKVDQAISSVKEDVAPIVQQAHKHVSAVLSQAGHHLEDSLRSKLNGLVTQLEALAQKHGIDLGGK